MTETLSDHDLLVRLDERVGALLLWSKAHDMEHAKVADRIESNRILIFGAIITAGVSIVGVILDLFLRH